MREGAQISIDFIQKFDSIKPTGRAQKIEQMIKIMYELQSFGNPYLPEEMTHSSSS